MSDSAYVGRELDLFANVHNWKRYWASQIQPYIKGEVLEVGAGIGANTSFISHQGHPRWVCLEPDPRLAAQIPVIRESESNVEVMAGTLASLGAADRFDTVIYIDVLEHIEHDGDELQSAAEHLHDGGKLVVLSPAHQWLFTPFDAAIGHYRRYNREMVRKITPASLRIEKLIYLDSAGLMASLANRLLLRQSMPTAAQLDFWDRRLIPISRVLDRIIGFSLGKSIVGVWRKVESAA